MASIGRINKLLQKRFGGAVVAQRQRSHLRLTGSLSDWDDVVAAGFLAAKHSPLPGLVNDIEFTGAEIPAMRMPALQDDSLEGIRCDVLVVGGGVVGCAIARELSRYKLDVLLADKECDVALHASSRNDGMVHPGLDLKKGSEKYRYNHEGNAMYDQLCRELNVDFRRCGQYLGFRNVWMKPALYLSLLHWKRMGIPAEVLGLEELRRKEPHLAEDIICGMFFPTAGIVCPYNLTIALAENAVQNGVRLSLDTVVHGMDTRDGSITAVHTNRGTLYPRVVVNAAGVFADEIARFADDRFFSIHPRRGTNSILDKKYSSRIVNTIAAGYGESSPKTIHTKGGGIVSTVHGNLLIGPDARETWDREDFATHRESVTAVFEKQGHTSPNLTQDKIITWFTGVRAPTYEEDFVITPGRYTKNIVHAAGIQSPGLTAAPAIGSAVAQMAVELLAKDAPIEPNPDFNPVRPPIPHVSKLPAEERAALIKQNPDYGEIVCRCEEVSRGEILAALRRPVPCNTVDAVKRRVRPGMGRCQGGFCEPLVAHIISEELGIPPDEVMKSGDGSRLLYGENKAALKGDFACERL